MNPYAEEVAVIEGFEEYGVTNRGDVVNLRTGRYLATRENAQGIVMVNLSKDASIYTRSVTLLVAQHFLDPHPYEAFNTPINLDGIRSNNHVDNLMWRPRWFAVNYHRQFKDDRITRIWFPLVILDTDEMFFKPIEAASKYGLLVKDVMNAIHNETQVWPTNYDIRKYRE